MTKKNESLIKKLEKRGPFRASETRLERYVLSNLVKEKKIIRLSHGIYIHPNSPVDHRYLDFAEAAVRFGKNSAIAGLTALFHYNLIEEVPNQIWVLVKSQINHRNDNSRYRLIRTKSSFKSGIKKHDFFQITNLERTLIESRRYSSKIGLSTGISACRKALNNGMTTEKKMANMADKLNLFSTFTKNWEAITA